MGKIHLANLLHRAAATNSAVNHHAITYVCQTMHMYRSFTARRAYFSLSLFLCNLNKCAHWVPNASSESIEKFETSKQVFNIFDLTVDTLFELLLSKLSARNGKLQEWPVRLQHTCDRSLTKLFVFLFFFFFFFKSLFSFHERGFVMRKHIFIIRVPPSRVVPHHAILNQPYECGLANVFDVYCAHWIDQTAMRIHFINFVRAISFHSSSFRVLVSHIDTHDGISACARPLALSEMGQFSCTHKQSINHNEANEFTVKHRAHIASRMFVSLCMALQLVNITVICCGKVEWRIRERSRQRKMMDELLYIWQIWTHRFHFNVHQPPHSIARSQPI